MRLIALLLSASVVVVSHGCGSRPENGGEPSPDTPALIKQLQDKDPGVRYQAAEELRLRGPDILAQIDRKSVV